MFQLVSPLEPAGDPAQTIAKLAEGLHAGGKHQVRLGVTGSGTPFTIANVVCNVGGPTLVISHDVTFAAQLHAEFTSFFPRNGVEHFVSYFECYAPGACRRRTDFALALTSPLC